MRHNQIVKYVRFTNPALIRDAEEACKPTMNNLSDVPDIYQLAAKHFSDERNSDLLFVATIVKLYSPVVYFGGCLKYGLRQVIAEMLNHRDNSSVSHLISMTKSYMKNKTFAAKVDGFINVVKEGV